MSAVLRAGGLFLKHGQPIRSNRTTVELEGVSIDVEYTLEGSYLAPTETEASECPVAVVHAAQIGGVDCLQVLPEEKLAALVERQMVRS